jgi:putative Mn2+ efflux pump MntP
MRVTRKLVRIMATLIVLGFVLSFDSFRASLGLGALKMRPVKQAQIVFAFGLCDGFAPLVGLLVGKSLVNYIGVWIEYFGPLVLLLYGVYVIYLSRQYAGKEAEETGDWMVLGLPLSLSLDNLVAGTSLGMIGFPIVISVLVIGAMSALMSFAGLLLGKTAVNLIKPGSELLAGVALVVIAMTLALENL